MTDKQRLKAVKGLLNTSVDDCKISLSGYTDPALLCDLLIACSKGAGHKSREQAVRQRISKLIKGNRK